MSHFASDTLVSGRWFPHSDLVGVRTQIAILQDRHRS